MKKFNIKPRRRKVKKPYKKEDIGNESSSFPNVSLMLCPQRTKNVADRLQKDINN